MKIKTERYASLLLKEINDILYNEIRDIDITGTTATYVKLADDLSYAKVYVSAMEGIETAKVACKGLTSAQGYIRRALGNNLHLRKSPELTFIADDSIEKGMEIFEKLKGTANED